MINRLLIRIKVLQVLYNYYLTSGMGVSGAISLLRYALDQSYQLYLFLTGLPYDLSEVARIRLDKEQDKYVKDEDIIKLLKHLADNPLTEIIASDNGYLEKRSSTIINSNRVDDYLNQVLQKAINQRDELNAISWNHLPEVRKAWRKFYGEEFLGSDIFYDIVEDSNTFRNDDIDIVFTFVTKAFNGICRDKPYSEQLKPAYSNEADMDFGPTLIEQAVVNGEEYRELISKYFKNWDKERTSEIDYIIMQLAVTEAIHFPQISTKVTINEYLNLAHFYSSESSYFFINGILHELFQELKSDGIIIGN